MQESRKTISAIGWTPADALGELLTRLLPLAQLSTPAHGSGRSAAFRAEAATLDLLLPALLDALIAQAETLDQAIAAVEVSNVLRASNGLIAWGVAELADAPPADVRGIVFVEVNAREELGSVSIDATIAV